MAVKKNKSRLARLGLGQKPKSGITHSSSASAGSPQVLPGSGLKDDRSRTKITRDGNELRTFTPERDAARREEVRRAAAAIAANQQAS